MKKIILLSNQRDLMEPIFSCVLKRLPWLITLLFLGLIVSATVGFFEDIVAKLPIVMCFQSLVLDMAGNVGTQSLAVTIRVLNNVGKKEKIKLVYKECQIGLLNGIILGILSFIFTGVYLFLSGNPFGYAFGVSFCLAISMIIAMVTAAFSGTVIPLFFNRIGIDPAVASGPLITTVNDLIAVISYYGLSWLILIHIMMLV